MTITRLLAKTVNCFARSTEWVQETVFGKKVNPVKAPACQLPGGIIGLKADLRDPNLGVQSVNEKIAAIESKEERYHVLTALSYEEQERLVGSNESCTEVIDVFASESPYLTGDNFHILELACMHPNISTKALKGAYENTAGMGYDYPHHQELNDKISAKITTKTGKIYTSIHP